MRQNPHVRICGGPGSATTLVYPTKGYRRIFSRFDKLDVLFLGFIHFALIFDALR